MMEMKKKVADVMRRVEEREAAKQRVPAGWEKKTRPGLLLQPAH